MQFSTFLQVIARDLRKNDPKSLKLHMNSLKDLALSIDYSLRERYIIERRNDVKFIMDTLIRKPVSDINRGYIDGVMRPVLWGGRGIDHGKWRPHIPNAPDPWK